MLKLESKRKGLSFKELVNAALRRGLAAEELPNPESKVTTRPHSFGFKPGIDLDKLNQLADELEVEAVAAKLRPSA
jgi:hypothetical protein